MKSSDVWDDSDLIDHWDRNIEIYRVCTKERVGSNKALIDITKKNLESIFETTSGCNRRSTFSTR